MPVEYSKFVALRVDPTARSFSSPSWRRFRLPIAVYDTRIPQPFDYVPQLGFVKIVREGDSWANLKKKLAGSS